MGGTVSLTVVMLLVLIAALAYALIDLCHQVAQLRRVVIEARRRERILAHQVTGLRGRVTAIERREDQR